MLATKSEKNESLMIIVSVSIDSLQRKEFCQHFNIKNQRDPDFFSPVLLTNLLSSQKLFQSKISRLADFQLGTLFCKKHP
jgi:hypothetical protein